MRNVKGEIGALCDIREGRRAEAELVSGFHAVFVRAAHFLRASPSHDNFRPGTGALRPLFNPT